MIVFPVVVALKRSVEVGAVNVAEEDAVNEPPIVVTPVVMNTDEVARWSEPSVCDVDDALPFTVTVPDAVKDFPACMKSFWLVLTVSEDPFVVVAVYSISLSFVPL